MRNLINQEIEQRMQDAFAMDSMPLVSINAALEQWSESFAAMNEAAWNMAPGPQRGAAISVRCQQQCESLRQMVPGLDDATALKVLIRLIEQADFERFH